MAIPLEGIIGKMKKYFTIKRIISIIIILFLLISALYFAYNEAVSRLKNDVPTKYIDIAAPIVVTFGDLKIEDIAGLDINDIISDTSKLVTVRILNHAGLVELEATRESPKFSVPAQSDNPSVTPLIMILYKNIQDSNWTDSVYQMKTVYDGLDGIHTDLNDSLVTTGDTTEALGFDDDSARAKYEMVKAMMDICRYLPALNGPVTGETFDMLHQGHFNDILDAIAASEDVEAVKLAIESIEAINADIAVKLTEFTTVHHFLSNIPKDNIFQELFSFGIGSEIVTPIFTTTPESGIKLTHYCAIIFEFGIDDLINNLPKIYLMIIGALAFLLLLAFIIPTKKSKKDKIG